jgi:nitrilase
VVFDTPFGRLGLSVCYDLRFPELYRRLGDMGAEIFLVPSAFTAVTGQAHWEILLRARAIENLCCVVAPAQGGLHAGGRETYGDSMIVDPWGVIQDRRPRDPGMVLGHIDREAVSRRRKAFPCLQHRRSDLTANSSHNEAWS